MLKLIGSLLKISGFILVVLVLGNWIRWDGKTVSDQIRLQMSHAERSDWMDSTRYWAEKIIRDTRRGFQNKHRQTASEEISSSERQKLKALIRELNSSDR